MIEVVAAVAGLIAGGVAMLVVAIKMLNDEKGSWGDTAVGMFLLIAGSLFLALALINGVQQAVLNVLELKELI